MLLHWTLILISGCQTHDLSSCLLPCRNQQLLLIATANLWSWRTLMNIKPHPVYQEVSGYICAANKCYPLDQIVHDKLNDRYVLLDPTAFTNTFSQPLEHD